MKLLFFGTPEFSRSIVEELSKNHEILGVVTQPDRRRGRGHRMQPSPVKKWAQDNDLPVFTPSSLKDETFLQEIRALGAEVFVVAAFGMLFPEELLTMAPRGALNIHTSLLPKFRGASPIESAILAGESISGVTLMKMDQGLDTGEIFYQEELSLEDKTAPDVLEEMIPLAVTLLEKLFRAWQQGEEVNTRAQTGPFSVCGKYDKSSYLLGWTDSAEHLSRKVRAFYPDAYIKWGNDRLKILQTSVHSSVEQDPGTVILTNDEGIYVSTGDGVLSIEMLQRSGRRAMTASDFLRGTPISLGTKLGG